MGRYVVRWHERAKDIFGDYSWYNRCEEEFVRKNEAEELFDWLSECENEGLVRNVSLYDKASKKTIKKYVPRD